MNITFLGTGTSHGVPMIGCDCPVCTSDDPRNRRMRSSVLIDINGVHLLIDTPPELRLQSLRENIRRVDAILFTHPHVDHLFGLDDVRRFNDLSGKPMPCYGSDITLDAIRRVFEYAFVPTQVGGGKPSLELTTVDGMFEIEGVKITPIPVFHGDLSVLGFRIGDFAYVTDVNHIPESSERLLNGLNTLVLGVLRPQPHETHFSLSQGLDVVEMLKPERAYFTHIAHKMDHESTSRVLPHNVQLAYDRLRISI